MKKILIVDDEQIMLSYLSLVVHDLGHQFICAENGKIGFEMFKTEKPDLIISDMVMPEMDGREFIESVRRLPLGKEVPIIILSGYAKIGDVASLLDAGATYFLKKPVDLKELQEYIKKAFNEYS
jgi:CheY-like chemotaxis protein